MDYDSADGEPATLLFLIAAPEGEADTHLEVLSRLSTLLLDADFCARLRAAGTPEEFRALVDAEKGRRLAEEREKAATSAARDAAGYDVLAITACPTGIAHTFMAAETLEKKAAEMGVRIKVETQGQGGAKNVITAADVAGARGVIIAADKNVDLARFDGKPLFSCSVTRGINEPGELIDIVMEGRAPICHAAGFVGGWIAKQGYTLGYLSTAMDADAQAALVSGGFLGALLAGFLAGYIVLSLERALEKLPSSLEGIKPILLYPVLGVFLTSLVMMGVSPVMGAINSALSGFLNGLSGTSIVLLGVIVAAMQATDMGGPINKAAYVFGTAALAEQTVTGNMIMAAVMAGGMVPPLAIALCTTLFKNRWTEADRKAGVVNYIMGLSFITEGAIPFAASDPLRVLPACIAGSAVAGGLSMLLGCASPAPHGGAWVIAVITNPVQYLLAPAAGAVVGCLVLALLKKPLPPEQSGLAK